MITGINRRSFGFVVLGLTDKPIVLSALSGLSGGGEGRGIEWKAMPVGTGNSSSPKSSPTPTLLRLMQMLDRRKQRTVPTLVLSKDRVRFWKAFSLLGVLNRTRYGILPYLSTRVRDTDILDLSFKLLARV